MECMREYAPQFSKEAVKALYNHKKIHIDSNSIDVNVLDLIADFTEVTMDEMLSHYKTNSLQRLQAISLINRNFLIKKRYENE